MMTGIPIENSLWTAYLLTIFFVVAGFAVYDVLYRRVPDRALVFFIPLAALAPVLQGYPKYCADAFLYSFPGRWIDCFSLSFLLSQIEAAYFLPAKWHYADSE